MKKRSTFRRDDPAYQLFMLSLCLLALVSLAAQSTLKIDEESRSILQYADTGVCLIFFMDFLSCLYRAENRWRYMTTWGWVDLASSIPVIDVARWGRAARVARIFRVLRGVRATKLLARLVLQRRAENTFLAATLVAILLVVVSSISVLHFESSAGEANVKTAEDALWWAFATITTVGYGDRYPVTSEGRFVAAILMAAGVALFGTFSAFLAKWFLESATEEENQELKALRHEVAALREAIERQQTVVR